jgi:DNA mismatch endonuclease, patch repair protein
MADCFAPTVRSRIMATVRNRHTAPELRLRKSLWSLGCRYRLHDRRVPGSPDISIPRARVAIFVDGCFWHGCPRCYTPPKSNAPFWRKKLKVNERRRHNVRRELRIAGWQCIEIWECDVERNCERAARRIQAAVARRLTEID